MKIPKNISNEKIEDYFNKIKLNELIILSKNKKSKLYAPILRDLYMIHQTIIINKRINILEFGSGYSSLLISNALANNKDKLKKIDFNKLGINEKFDYQIIDDQKPYMGITKKRILKSSLNKIVPKLNYTKCELVKINGLLCTEYKKLPNFVPDFIYLDGPDLNKINNELNGINISKCKNFMPMSSDILKIENFLMPGAIIIIDGRGGNAGYLLRELRRNWKYKYNDISDQHFLYLNDKPLGQKSKKLLEFYKN